MMENRATEEHKIWLFDLAHGNLSELQTVKGFIKFYALNGFTTGNVIDDVVFRTHYNAEGIKETLTIALENFIEKAVQNENKSRKRTADTRDNKQC